MSKEKWLMTFGVDPDGMMEVTVCTLDGTVISSHIANCGDMEEAERLMREMTKHLGAVEVTQE